jgi:RNA polymerase sigma-70 factor (ECF subfamily)
MESSAHRNTPEERTGIGGLRTKLGLRASNELIASNRDRRLLMRATKPISGEAQAAVDELLEDLHAKCDCEKIGLNRESFSAILCEVTTKYLVSGAKQSEVRALLLTLRVEDLALARACAEGHNTAWEVFLTRYREKLYQSAWRIAREDSAARDLADSLFAELYGTTTRDGQRVSKLASFTGRGSLEGWLRTVLAQEFVNRYRRTKRLVSLDEENEEGAQFAAPEPEPAAHSDSRLEVATDQALAALPSEDRLVLAAYYLDGRTLAEIARMLSVHESTISRRVDKLAKMLRKKILAGMMQQGMTRRQAEEALDVDVRDVQVNIRRSLAQDSAPDAFPKKKEVSALRQNAAPRAKT